MHPGSRMEFERTFHLSFLEKSWRFELCFDVPLFRIVQVNLHGAVLGDWRNFEVYIPLSKVLILSSVGERAFNINAKAPFGAFLGVHLCFKVY